MKIKLLENDLNDYDIKPTREGDAGIDLRCCNKEVEIYPGETKFINSGIAVAIPEGWVGQLYPRSGLGVKKGLTLANTVGIIDANFRGEILIAAKNTGRDIIEINYLDRIAQLVVTKHYHYPYICIVDELDSTERGDKGFGSSGDS